MLGVIRIRLLQALSGINNHSCATGTAFNSGNCSITQIMTYATSWESTVTWPHPMALDLGTALECLATCGRLVYSRIVVTKA